MKKAISAILGAGMTLAFAGVSLMAQNTTPAPATKTDSSNVSTTKSTKAGKKTHATRKSTSKSVSSTPATPAK